MGFLRMRLSPEDPSGEESSGSRARTVLMTAEPSFLPILATPPLPRDALLIVDDMSAAIDN